MADVPNCPLCSTLANDAAHLRVQFELLNCRDFRRLTQDERRTCDALMRDGAHAAVVDPKRQPNKSLTTILYSDLGRARDEPQAIAQFALALGEAAANTAQRATLDTSVLLAEWRRPCASPRESKCRLTDAEAAARNLLSPYGKVFARQVASDAMVALDATSEVLEDARQCKQHRTPSSCLYWPDEGVKLGRM